MLALYAAAVGIGLLAQFSGPLWVLLGAYVAINLGYSLGLKLLRWSSCFAWRPDL